MGHVNFHLLESMEEFHWEKVSIFLETGLPEILQYVYFTVVYFFVNFHAFNFTYVLLAKNFCIFIFMQKTIDGRRILRSTTYMAVKDITFYFKRNATSQNE